MTDAARSATGNIRDLTDQVVARTMNTLRATLPAEEFAALEELVTSGTFLDPKAILSAIGRVQDREDD